MEIEGPAKSFLNSAQLAAGGLSFGRESPDPATLAEELVTLREHGDVVLRPGTRYVVDAARPLHAVHGSSAVGFFRRGAELVARCGVERPFDAFQDTVLSEGVRYRVQRSSAKGWTIGLSSAAGSPSSAALAECELRGGQLHYWLLTDEIPRPLLRRPTITGARLPEPHYHTYFDADDARLGFLQYSATPPQGMRFKLHLPWHHEDADAVLEPAAAFLMRNGIPHKIAERLHPEMQAEKKITIWLAPGAEQETARRIDEVLVAAGFEYGSHRENGLPVPPVAGDRLWSGSRSGVVFWRRCAPVEDELAVRHPQFSTVWLQENRTIPDPFNEGFPGDGIPAENRAFTLSPDGTLVVELNKDVPQRLALGPFSFQIGTERHWSERFNTPYYLVSFARLLSAAELQTNRPPSLTVRLGIIDTRISGAPNTTPYRKGAFSLHLVADSAGSGDQRLALRITNTSSTALEAFYHGDSD